MYCRQCEYDLRGLIAFRCPECGTAFDPSDESSVRSRPRCWTARAALGARRGAIVALFLAFATYTVGSQLFSRNYTCGGISYGIVSQNNLKHIVTQWRLADHERSGPRPATPLSLPTSAFERRWSPYQQRHSVHASTVWTGWIQQSVALPAFVLALFLAISAVLTRARWRRACVGGAIVVVVLAALARWPGGWSKAVWSADHVYLTDYKYVPKDQWSQSYRGAKMIIAYDKQPLDGSSRVVAFADGSANRLPEAEFRQRIPVNSSDLSEAGDRLPGDTNERE